MASTPLIFLVLTFIGFSAFVLFKMNEVGLFTHTEDFNIENCKVIAQVSGCEDLQVDSSSDLLYLSVNDWTSLQQGKKAKSGGIYTLDLKEKDAKPKLASIDQPDEFFPHGIHLYTDPQTEEKTLFVINHKLKENTIEIFDVIDSGVLKLRKSVSHPLLKSPNEILGTGKSSFYVTQDTKHSPEVWYLPLLVLFGLEEGSLFYYDGANWKIVAENLHFGNGLASSTDNKLLYVGESTKQRIRVYERDLKTGNVQFKKSHKLHVSPDNFNVDSQGNLWIATFPNLVAMTAHLTDKTFKSPVQITKVSFNGEELVDLQKVLTSSGNVISGISAVDTYKGNAILAGLLNTEIRMCNLSKDRANTKVGVDTDL